MKQDSGYADTQFRLEEHRLVIRPIRLPLMSIVRRCLARLHGIETTKLLLAQPKELLLKVRLETYLQCPSRERPVGFAYTTIRCRLPRSLRRRRTCLRRAIRAVCVVRTQSLLDTHLTPLEHQQRAG